MPEKKRPHHDLPVVQRAFSTVSGLALTGTALRDATALGFGRSDIVEAIAAMRPRHFYKSMTAYDDPRSWRMSITSPPRPDFST